MNHRFFPHTDQDREEMLRAVGSDSIDDLFDSVPASCRMDDPCLPEAMDEWRLSSEIGGLADRGGGDWTVYANAGSGRRHIPAIVPALANRSEFLTAYTPYQPEMSQGTLQAIFEFQTLIARLTGMDAANASMYDGATAMAETVLMAMRITRRNCVAISSLVHPHWRHVLHTYLKPIGAEVMELPATASMITDLAGMDALDQPAVLVVQSPNFFGVIEDLKPARDMADRCGALLAAGFSEPLALGMIKPPGHYGADIVFGEGQGLGLPQSFGGPGLGLLACGQKYIRQIPGRLVGETVDNRGQRSYVLTLSTREQHIRRGRAVSNICSNAGHAALTASVFMAAAGGSGFRRLAQINRDTAEYLKNALLGVGFTPLTDRPTFNEFALHAPDWFIERRQRLLEHRIVAGLDLSIWYPAMDNVWLFGATEVHSRDAIDAFVTELGA